VPHICTRCDSVFQSGEDILKGCPACGWKKFLFVRRISAEGKDQSAQTGQIITKAMGVRVPPKGRPKVEIEREDIVREMAPKDNEPMDRSSREKPIVQPANPPSRSSMIETSMKEDQLESIKITSPGSYELNLPSLFEREELIMAVKEGTYFIDLSSAFRKGKKE
jgi:predicted  nucleic acid-binding Zn-ribbon protein